MSLETTSSLHMPSSSFLIKTEDYPLLKRIRLPPCYKATHLAASQFYLFKIFKNQKRTAIEQLRQQMMFHNPGY